MEELQVNVTEYQVIYRIEVSLKGYMLGYGMVHVDDT
jgi:hypothetical protein